MLDGFLSFQFMNKKIRKTLFMSTLILHIQKNICSIDFTKSNCYIKLKERLCINFEPVIVIGNDYYLLAVSLSTTTMTGSKLIQSQLFRLCLLKLRMIDGVL